MLSRKGKTSNILILALCACWEENTRVKFNTLAYYDQVFQMKMKLLGQDHHIEMEC
jgi:hypothetical protein